jgi:hypothetical protein
VFTGGTGIFAGATGDAAVTGTITSTSATTESISGTYTGNLTAATPIPAALPLFATGLSALGLFGWRRKRKPRRGAAHHRQCCKVA